MTSTQVRAGTRQTSGERFGWELAAATFAPLLLVGLVAVAVPFDERVLWLIALTAAPHVMAGFGFYFDRDARTLLTSDRRRFYYAPAVILSGFGLFGAMSSHLDPRVISTAVAGFFVWQFHHFSRQNYGVLALALRGWGLDRMSDREARLIRLGGLAAMVGGVRPVRLVFGELLVPDALVDLAAAVGFGLMVAALVELVRARREGATGRRFGMLLGLTVFHLPLFFGAAPAVGLGMHAAAHPFQYGLIMWRTREGRDRDGTVRTTVVLLALAIGGAWLLRRLYGTADTIDGAAVGLAWGVLAWHFVLDAGVWKMSKPEPRAYMKRRFSFL